MRILPVSTKLQQLKTSNQPNFKGLFSPTYRTYKGSNADDKNIILANEYEYYPYTDETVDEMQRAFKEHYDSHFETIELKDLNKTIIRKPVYQIQPSLDRKMCEFIRKNLKEWIS